MGKTAAIGASAEYVYHVQGVRWRVNGTGNLKMTLFNLDDTRSYVMKPLPMSMTPGLEPTRQANFRSQRTALEFKTTELDEYMNVSRILIFMKPSATSLPM